MEHIEPSHVDVRWHRPMWVLQIVLFLLFTARGALEIFVPTEVLGEALGWPARFVPDFIRTLGVLHIVAALLLVLPMGRRWRPTFVPPAALFLGYWSVLESVLFMTENRFLSATIALVPAAAAIMLSWARALKVPVAAPPRRPRTALTRGRSAVGAR